MECTQLSTIESIMAVIKFDIKISFDLTISIIAPSNKQISIIFQLRKIFPSKLIVHIIVVRCYIYTKFKEPANTASLLRPGSPEMNGLMT